MVQPRGPAVTILMPVAAVRQYVREAALSVLKQKFSGLELILIDDVGQVDDLARIAAELNDPRVRAIASEGKGIADALNTGLAVARGTFWGRCDADDLYPPDRLEKQVGFLEAHPDFGAVCGSMWAMTPKGKFLADMNGEHKTEEITDELRRGVARSSLCTWTVRTDLMRAVGGFRKFFATAEDIDLQFRLAERSRIWYVAEMAYHYRLHDTSTTHTQPSTRRAFFDRMTREFQQQRQAHGTDDLDEGWPPEPPPADASPVQDATGNTQQVLMGASWEKHRAGRKTQALALGWQACWMRPGNLSAWRSLGALTMKRAGK